MERKKLIAYLPELLRGNREIRQITKNQQQEIDRALEDLEMVFSNQFIESATQLGISRWEKLLSIPPTSDMSLEDRRRAVQLRLLERVPFTMRALEILLESICGEGKFEVMLNPLEYALRVDVDSDLQSLHQAVKTMLRRVIPANLIGEFQVSIPQAGAQLFLGGSVGMGIGITTLPQLGEPGVKGL